jgi:hypothetical protein
MLLFYFLGMMYGDNWLHQVLPVIEKIIVGNILKKITAVNTL